ncbi:unnamed protein product [Cylicocyclus nassatus]|uniref:Uncharacterized protein n=1 Tax=Cylicocyclus nassatus TaxID=53992 RepID=A0AA36M7Q7_CYLNA|nr:unnamed protein product [Cylicocyclus nassatus]
MLACDNEESVNLDNLDTLCCDEDVSVIEGSEEEVVSMTDKRKELVTELQEKTQHVQSECEAEYTGNIVADELNICVLCDDTQPPLEDPEDEPVMEGADILWWSCTSCRAWVHKDCMQCRDCPVCGGVFEPTG